MNNRKALVCLLTLFVSVLAVVLVGTMSGFLYVSFGETAKVDRFNALMLDAHKAGVLGQRVSATLEEKADTAFTRLQADHLILRCGVAGSKDESLSLLGQRFIKPVSSLNSMLGGQHSNEYVFLWQWDCQVAKEIGAIRSIEYTDTFQPPAPK